MNAIAFLFLIVPQIGVFYNIATMSDFSSYSENEAYIRLAADKKTFFWELADPSFAQWCSL